MISNVRVKLINDGFKLRAVSSITFDNEFVIHGIKLIENNNGDLFIAMPSIKKEDGSYSDIAHPINSKTRNLIQCAIIDEYKKCIDN